MRGRLLLVVPGLLLVLAGPAGAAWVFAGTGQGSAAAAALQVPGAGVAGAPSSGSLTLTWAAPAAGPAPSGYVVLRDGTQVVSGGCAETATRTSTAVTCTDTGLTASTAYSYVVRPVLGTSWVGPATASFAGTTAAFVMRSATEVGGSKKYRFGGIGSSGTTTITVEVCRGTVAVCTPSTPDWVETVSFAPGGAGAWSTGPTTTKLELTPGPYTATATQAPSSSTLAFTAV